MAEKETKKEISETQLNQMARQEEQNLMNQKAILEKLGSILRETITAKEVLKEMQNTNGKVMINIGATVLVEVEAKNIKKCKRGFSENTYKEENVDETIKWIEEKEENLKKQATKMGQEYSETQQRFTNIIGILKQIETEKKKLMEKRRQQPITISK